MKYLPDAARQELILRKVWSAVVFHNNVGRLLKTNFNYLIIELADFIFPNFK